MIAHRPNAAPLPSYPVSDDMGRPSDAVHRRRTLAQDEMTMPRLFMLVISVIIIFIIDTITDLEIAVAVLYVIVILIAARTKLPRRIAGVGLGCGALTILSYAISSTGSQFSGLSNCILSLIVIGSTTYLACKSEVAATAMRNAQNDLARLSRTMVVGEMSSMISHEVSQPLAAIAANSSAALRWLAAAPPNQQEARQAIERVVSDAARAGTIVDRVRRLVARSPVLRDSVEIAELVAETIALLRARVQRSTILVRTEFPHNFPAVMGDRIQLQQVVLNLLVNAIESLSDTVADGRKICVAGAWDGRAVTVTVEDTGQKTPPDFDRLFEPFYSTKPGGTGMGLAICRTIIEGHRGSIHARAAQPRGMVFEFSLPAASGKETVR